MSEKLTNDQNKIYQFLKKSIRANGKAPSINEICVETELFSPAIVKKCLKKLADLNYIELKFDPDIPNQADIKILNHDELTSFEIHSTVITSKDGTRYENIPVFSFDLLQEACPGIIKFLKQKKYFIIKDLDSSMEKAGVKKDSVILVDTQAKPKESGDPVVAFFDNQLLFRAVYNIDGKIVFKTGDEENYPDIVGDNTAIHLGSLAHVFDESEIKASIN